MLRKRLQTSQTEMGGKDEGREVPFEIGLSGDQKGQGQRRTTQTRRRIFTHEEMEFLGCRVEPRRRGFTRQLEATYRQEDCRCRRRGAGSAKTPQGEDLP